MIGDQSGGELAGEIVTAYLCIGVDSTVNMAAELNGFYTVGSSR